MSISKKTKNSLSVFKDLFLKYNLQIQCPLFVPCFSGINYIDESIKIIGSIVFGIKKLRFAFLEIIPKC